MSILIDESSKVLVQGITGGEGKFHSRKMAEYGTNVLAGVTREKVVKRSMAFPYMIR